VKPPEGVAALAQTKWRSSGLGDAHAKALKLKALTGEETRDLASNFLTVGSLHIPYFDIAGKPTGFFRVRYLEALPGFAGATKKPQRYAQPADTLNEVYLPPVINWAKVAADPEKDILIVEGELKAAAGCVNGFATVGLGGVDVWRSKKKGVRWLPPLDKIEWKGRRVTIVFDSDAATNPDVIRAQRQLAKELTTTHGAQVYIAALADRLDGSKVGLDDFLVAHGSEKLDELLENAQPYEEGDALWKMNEELLYIKDPGFVINRASGQRMDPGKFVSHHYANRYFMGVDAKGAPKKKPLAAHWLGWEHRAEADKAVYAPGKPQMHEGSWNMWGGWGCEPKAGDVSLWTELLDHIFNGNPGAKKWFEQWCAYPIQHPGTKLYTAPLLWSRIKGVGKSLLGYSLMSIYGRNSVEIKSRQLKGSFNSWAQNRQLVVGDEITAGEARTDADWIKGTITQHKVTINVKYLPEHEIVDCINYLFFSNHCDALFVEDAERRYFIWEIILGKKPQEFYDRYDKWLGWSSQTGKAEGPGPAALFAHLLKVDLTGFHPKGAAPETSSRDHMIRNSKSDLGLWVEDLRTDPERMLRVLGEKAANEGNLFTARMLLRAFDPEGRTRMTEAAVGRHLATAGFPRANEGQPVRTKGGVIRLFAIREPEKWVSAKPKRIADEFDRVFGDTKF
jgi:hypothetical protein